MNVIKICHCCGRRYANEGDFLRYGNRFRMCDQGHLWFSCECLSTLLLKSPESDWFSYGPLSPAGNKVFSLLNGRGKIPLFSSAAMQLIEKIENPESSIDQIVRDIRKEPVLSAQILNVATIQSLSKGERIKDLHHAVVYLGRSKIREVTLLAAVSLFKLSTKNFSMNWYLRSSHAAGFIAAMISKKMQLHLELDTLFFSVSLANVGKLLQALTFPTETDAVFDRCHSIPTRDRWVTIEQDYLPAKHTVFGEIAGILWGLPKQVIDFCELHHNQKALFLAKVPTALDLCAVALQLSYSVLGEPFQIDSFIVSRFLRSTGLTQEWLDETMIETKISIERITSE